MNSYFIAMNVLKRTMGQKKNLFTFLILPALIISLIIGLLGKQATTELRVHYVNADKGQLAKVLLQELANKPNYKLIEVNNLEVLKEQVISKKTGASFSIPESFSEQILAGSSPKVDLFQLNISEASFVLNLNLELAIVRMEQSVQSVKARGIAGPELLTTIEKLFTEQHKQKVKATITDFKLYPNPLVFLTTGLLLMFTMGLINSSVSIIMEDRKQMTMTRIYTAPVRAYEIALGNFMGSFIIGFLQIVIVLIISRYVMGFDYGLPFGSHLIILLFFMLASLGIATTVSGLAKNSNVIGMINNLIITPTCMIGGCFWPIEIMPSFMQKLANFVPQKWAIEAIQNLASGQTLAQNSIQIAVLTLFAIILLGFGSVVLRPSEAETY